MTTMRDVAERAGVSVATVSHVINDTQYVSPELRERVLNAIETLDYRPNKLARALSKKAIPLVALIVPDISNPYWSIVARAVQDVTDGYRFSVIVCSTDGLFEREVRFLQSLAGWVSGVIFHPYHVTHEHTNRHLGKVPVVIVGEFLSDEGDLVNWDHVGGDNQGGARQAVEHLIDLGHRRIGFIQGPADTPTSERRLAGFQQALELAGLVIDERLLMVVDYTREAGRQGMAALLEAEPPPTAVFCANDVIALGALEAAKECGCDVPGDVSIVGFDDIDEAVHTSPPLTTIRQPPRRLGKAAAEMLMERIEGRDEPRRIFYDSSLIVRESTAPPRGE